MIGRIFLLGLFLTVTAHGSYASDYNATFSFAEAVGVIEKAKIVFKKTKGASFLCAEKKDVYMTMSSVGTSGIVEYSAENPNTFTCKYEAVSFIGDFRCFDNAKEKCISTSLELKFGEVMGLDYKSLEWYSGFKLLKINPEYGLETVFFKEKLNHASSFSFMLVFE
ncbi:MAG: hypothetical protein A2X86_14915 [Bdellovibrionales bacterium GWA2_49_15]|nr:MAG: hypothetical protein A2X86_14915 [Bdellovibrionales bacterium GWA2_49_15]HAZ13366.1 hypothetical protein [Bdellovibrionales bacterium]